MNFRSGNFNRGMYPNNYPNRDSNNRANHPVNNGANSCAGKEANRLAGDLQRGGEVLGAMEPIAGAPNDGVSAINSNPTAANPTGVPEPPSLTELKRLIQQFGVFLPEDKRQVIEDTVAQLEASGGVQSEEQGRRLLAQLLGALGLQSGAQ